MTLKKVAGKIHLYLGLVSGLVVFVVSITGCIYVFEEEIFHALNRDLVFVQPEKQPRKSVAALKDLAEAHFDGKKEITGIMVPPSSVWLAWYKRRLFF